MKKTVIAALSAALLSSALIVPARANDMGNMGIGLGIAILGQMMKSGNHSSGHASRDREPGRGDKLVGRSDGNTRSERGNGRSAPASTDPAITLPDVGPEIAFRPSDEEVAAILAADASAPADAPSSIPVASTFTPGQSVDLIDENSLKWGSVSPEVAAKIVKATDLGMTRSQAIAALSGLKKPEQGQAMQAASDAALADVNATLPVAVANQQAIQVNPASMPMPSQGVTGTFADGSDGSELEEQAQAPVTAPSAPTASPVASVAIVPAPVVSPAPAPVVQPVKQVAVDDRHGAYGTIWNRDHTKGTVRDENNNVWGYDGDLPADVIAKIDAMTASGMKRSEAIAANTDMAAPGKSKAQAAKEAADLAAAQKRKADQEARYAAAVQKEKADAANRQRLVEEARAKAEADRVLAEQLAAEQAKTDAERQAAEAALPPVLRSGSQPVAAVAPSTTPNAAPAPSLPAVDPTATTASVTVDVAPVAPQAPAKVDPAPAPKKADLNIDL